MERRGFLFYLFLLNIVIYCGRYWEVSGCLDRERKALTTFRKALNDPFNILSSWDDEASDCCKWRGITCHNITGYVLKLDLNTYNDSLSGRIDPALVELKHLQLLDLSDNAFHGIPIPQFLGSMKELRHLNLSEAGFSGRIPHQLGNLSKLISLQLSSYPFSDSLSAKNLWWLTNLTSLKYLELSYVNLSMASHDWVHVMNKCPSLVELRLFECHLSYISPTLASVNFTSLRVLDLTLNHFNSTIPKWIANISSLVSLYLSFSNFDGPVPYQFSQLPNLEELQLGGSLCPNCSRLPEGSWSKLKILHLYFSELHGGIPNSVWNMTSLKSLSFSFRENIRGCIPRAITKLVNLESLSLYGGQMNAPIPEWFNELKNLKNLFLKGCMLGPIPASLGRLSSLQSLDLSWNQLNGSIPAALGGLSSLQSLDLSRNQLNGNIPAALGGLSSLQSIDLSRIQLNGNIPAALGRLSSLQSLDFSGNQLIGSIPAALGGLSSLQFFDLSGNQLNGSIPPAVGGLSSLQFLDLNGNQLNENIPTTLGQLSTLSLLDLSNNSLTGNVSETHFEYLKKLDYLDLSFNCLVFDIHSDWVPPFQLSRISLRSSCLGLPPWIRTQKYIQELNLYNTTISGVIPTWFWDFTTQLSSLDLSNNQISGQLPNPLKMLPANYIDLSLNNFSGPIPCILNGVVVLDLSNNHFSGPIPPNFTSTMYNLQVFSARGNQISGIIPSSIGKMKSLLILDLSQNNISGTIPLRLGDCVDLRALDLSKNRLSGRIPTSLGLLHQLQSMHLSDNSLSGKVLSSLKNCTLLETLDLGQNNFSGHIPTWIGKSFLVLRILSLRSNMFTGNIPPQLLNITSLQVLDVGQNCLSGSIPQTLQNLTAMKIEQNTDHFPVNGTKSYYEENLVVSMKGLMLEYTRTLSLVTCMDLSSNNLSGEVPEELTSLFGLRVLNLSGNHLTGKIPDKIGNLALLESLDFSKNQLSDKCDTDETSQRPMPVGGDVKKDDGAHEMVWFYSALTPGFAVGFSAFCGVLVLKRAWRIAYYHFIDEMKERLLYSCRFARC
ncbi:receptor-like protein EIX1 isoform X2 [Magnolia sinica]|uniref:receptor-like protein EIX1 isoform X2 n=1 Tax=Magnolia sinica TaxID=86752 RepID=UPI00265A2FE6|nr:receptor-like protein EIX1 isoform X2 [Magnolia sinica]